MTSIIPLEDHHQALRIKRFLMACATYAVWLVLALYCEYDGLFVRELIPTSWVFIGVIVSNAVFYVIFRTGVNKRFADPSFTMIQMALATLWTMTMAYSLNEGRQIMLLLYMVVFIFGSFKLSLRQFWLLTAFALAVYAWVIQLLLVNDPGSVNIKLEIFSMATLFTVLTWFSFMGSYINSLRKKLSMTNSELAKTNEALGEANDRIRQQAVHDDLTGAYNRGHLFTILSREKSLADRGETMFSVCMFDLDDFKKVNDTHGHQAGDTVLKTVCERIEKNIRKEDYLARYGGEEFVLILAYPDMEESLVCADRIRRVIRETRFQGLPEDFFVTVSMGLTSYRPVEDIDDLLKRADEALYRAKHSGKDAIECDPPAERLTAVG
jgi:diguanylate cyclase (GGDEF)-like protein